MTNGREHDTSLGRLSGGQKAAAVAVVLGLVVLVVGLAFKSNQRSRRTTPRARFELVRVDDRVDPFGSLDRSTLPTGVAIDSEPVPLGPETGVTNHYFRVRPGRNESVDDAVARIQPWLSSIRLPPDTRVALGRYEEQNLSTERWVTVGARSYVLRGQPVVTSSDVESAESVPNTFNDSVSVFVTLRAEARARVAAATREHSRRRLAIVINGRVQSAPIVTGEISDGRVSISLGVGDFEQQREQATQLAASLSPE